MVPEEREVGRESHPAVAQLFICVSNYRSDQSKDVVAKYRIESHRSHRYLRQRMGFERSGIARHLGCCIAGIPIC